MSVLKSMYLALITGGSAVSAHTYDTFPDNDDVTLTAHATADTWGDWAQIVSSVGASDIWACGLYVSNPSIDLDGKVDLGTGASGSEATRAVFPYRAGLPLTTNIDYFSEFYTLPFPIFVPNGTREAARAKTGTATADTLDVVEHHAVGVTVA